MKLYVTETSPYARIARIMVLEKASALGLETRHPGFRWRPGHPKLSAWFDHVKERPSLAATAPRPL
jgi:glutathione S-transferase